MANWQNFFSVNDDEDEDDETAFDSRFATKDGVIFLIDTNQTMFQKSADDESHFDLCIKCARSVLSNKIISSDKDLVGVVFFGTDKHKNKNDFQHIYVLQDLEQPSAAKILELELYLKDTNNDFEMKYGHSSSFSLSDALWCCSNMFSQCTQKLGHKRILLFTNNDNPHVDNVAFQRQAKTRASDLNSIGIDIELLHLRLPGQNFDVSKFYQDIIFAPEDEDFSVMPDASDKFEELLTRVRTKDHKKRSQGRLNLCLGSGLDLAVSVYNLTSKTRKPYSVKLYKKTNEEVRTKSTYFCQETGEQLMPSDVKKFQNFGGRKIVFEKDELQEMKKFYDPGLMLLGFKPKSSIKGHFHLKNSHFLFPDENRIKGSTPAFSALLQKCISRDVVPICRYTARKNTPPRFVALLPQKEEFDDQNVQVQPSGFHVIPLPYSDDLRKLKFQETPKANPEQVDKAKDIIKKLQFKFNPSSFENPDVQMFWRNLEVLALDKDTPEEFIDFTAPDVDRINSRAGVLINEFKEMVFPDGYTSGAKSAPKRKPAGDLGANKRSKTDDTTEVDVGKMAKEGKLAKLTVADLRSFCQAKKLQTSGKKSELVDRVREFCGE